MHSALAVSSYVIESEASKRRLVSNLRLQKLLYYIQAAFLRKSGEPLFYDRIEAWDCGPIIPTVYREYKFFGSYSIPAQYNNSKCNELSENEKKSIDDVLDGCAMFSTTALTKISLLQTPWKSAYGRVFDNEIHNDEIKSFFCD